MPSDQWYALYRNSDKVVVAGGFVSSESLALADHTVIGPFDAPIIDLGVSPDGYLKQWNTETEQFEDIP
jgi:hypothetical protein